MIQVRPQERAHKTRAETHYGFRETPFTATTDPRFFYDDAAYRKNLAELTDGIKARKGLMVVTGETGTGKTTLIRRLMRNLRMSVEFIFISNSHLTSHALLDLMTCDLGLPKTNSRLEAIRQLDNFLTERVKDGGTFALVIDEAQSLREAVLETIYDLSNLEADRTKLLQIVLVGQPELIKKLNKPSLRQLKQRIAMQQRLDGLQTVTELKGYLKHSLRVAGYDGPEIFTQGAINSIWSYSGGLPRQVNLLCDNSLTLACEAGNGQVSAEMVTRVAETLQFAKDKQNGSAVPPISVDLNSETHNVKTDERTEPFTNPDDPTQNDNPRKRIRLRWKIAGVFASIILILGCFLVTAAYRLTDQTLQDQLDKRATAITTNLSDASAGHIMGHDTLLLNTLLRKYTLLEGVAYAFVRDSEGSIVAHTLGTFPRELRNGLPVGKQRAAVRRELTLAGRSIYEISVPVLDGQIGNIHVGFWEEVKAQEIQRAIVPLVGIIAILSVLAILLSFVVAHWLARPITRLTKVAERITTGDLEASGEYINSRDEIGQLARSLERMRVSLKAAMSRLDHPST